jgi:predicted RNase H-like HicB family nuclease
MELRPACRVTNESATPALCSEKFPPNHRYERHYSRRLAGWARLFVMKLPKLTAVIEPGEDGWYVANCPELGIVSQGETPERAEAMLKEAVELWLECADETEVRRRLQERKVAIKELEVTHA